MHRRGVSADDLAGHLDGGLDEVRGLLDGSNRIDDRSSAVLSELLGGSQGFWLRRQENFENALARALHSVAEHAGDWLDHVPMPRAKGRRPTSASAVLEEVRRRMLFYSVPTLASWEQRYGRICTDTHFRRSMSFVPQDSAVLLWLRRGELEADIVHTRSWSPDQLRERLDQIRKLTRISHPSRFLPKLRSLCAEAGVAVVVVRTPKGCHASGATRLVSPDKAMMLLSFRHRADDQFWFTVFHEIGHLLLHGAETFVDGDETPDDDFEKEANDFARQCIIPQDREEDFCGLKADRKTITRFSVSLGIAPGLTVGQMQHLGKIEHSQMNFLKRRWTWEDIEHAVV
jgi:Zn-dependent peptidase ImmA (M78 family)/plasmid maintenance system antidote protein VapI